MKDRLDLENEISSLYNFSEQLEHITESIKKEELSTDEIVNVLLGMKIMLNIHSSKLMDTMCQCFKLDDYRPIMMETEDYL